MSKPFKFNAYHRHFVIHVEVREDKVMWSTEDVTTLAKYGSSLQITDGPLAPGPAMQVATMLEDQWQRTIDKLMKDRDVQTV